MPILLFVIILTICACDTKKEAPKNALPKKNVLKPILLDKSTLSGVGLRKINLKDTPQKDFFQKNLYRGTDLSVYVVSSQSWKSKMENFGFDEFIYILNGQARVKPENGAEQYFYTGDYFFCPKGYKGDWDIQAGENYHYELSVITTLRADSIQQLEQLRHQLLDKSILSGTSIQLDTYGLYETNLAKGVELTINLKAEEPRKITLQNVKEQLICVLSGQVSIKDANEDLQTFYTGDFFLLPKDFDGAWESKGHGVVKYISVQKSE